MADKAILKGKEVENKTIKQEKNGIVKAVCYHDGECPLCNIEIKAMKKTDKANAIRWVDISKEKEALREAGITYKEAMDRIHVQNENGQMLTGVLGFMTVWKLLPYYRRVVPVIKNVPFLLTIMEAGYRLFTRYRLPLTGKKQIKRGEG